MTRIKRGFVANRRRKKILKSNTSNKGATKKLFRIANQKYIKSKILSYKNRKKFKRVFRNLWIHRINSTVRWSGVNFSQFFNRLRKEKISLNRKIISQLAIYDPESFFCEINL